MIGFGQYATTPQAGVACLAHGEEVLIAIEIGADLAEGLRVLDTQGMSDGEIVARTAKNARAVSLKYSNLLTRSDSPTNRGYGSLLLTGFSLGCIVNVGSAMPTANDVLAPGLTYLAVVAAALRTWPLRVIRVPAKRFVGQIAMEGNRRLRQVGVIRGYFP